MATKTTTKKTVAELAPTPEIQPIHIVWPTWFKASVILMGIYSTLMILSFFFTLYVMVSRQGHGF